MNPLMYVRGGIAILVLGLMVWGGMALHGSIKDSGRAEVQALWDADKKAHEVEITKLKEDYALREEAHRTENRRISHELSEAKLEHANAIAAVRNDYLVRLRTSEKRAGIYQRQAEGGAAERRSLAEHASRLDASLEEGRSLVRELRETLGLRDRQIRSLSEQILNDRQLFTETPEE